MYRDYDTVRFIYQTPISSWGNNALDKAAEDARTRASRWYPDDREYHGWAYRVVDNDYSYIVDAEREEYGVETKLEIVAFPIIKATGTGFRIRRGGTEEQPETRWVSDSWNKQWASRTPEEAVRSLIARRKRQARIYESRAKKAKHVAQKAERLLTPERTIL